MQFKTFDIIPHDTKFDFVGKRHIAVTLSLIANAAVILWAIFHGLNFGVDFAGGTEMEVKFEQTVDPGAIRTGVEALGFKDASVQTYGAESEHTYLIRVGRIALMSQEDVDRVVKAVEAKFPVQGTPHFNPDVGDKIDFQFQGAPPTTEQLKAAVQGAGVAVREVREEAGLTAGTRSFAVITQGIQGKIENELVQKFGEAKPDVRRVEYVGPAVGR
ncbi:MAG TPA: protein translocase subunit SecF, partial [Anaeromyxobacteraceae bacterium]